MGGAGVWGDTCEGESLAHPASRLRGARNAWGFAPMDRNDLLLGNARVRGVFQRRHFLSAVVCMYGRPLSPLQKGGGPFAVRVRSVVCREICIVICIRLSGVCCIWRK